jgi:2-methylisocitrate lyase-like PEP mutase family enzyme
MRRTVKVLERAGAAGLQIEDQVFPKKCGHFAGKDVVPLPEMVAKIKAAVDARRDGDLQIVARTDARAMLGLEAALDRAHAFIEAGADATFRRGAGVARRRWSASPASFRFRRSPTSCSAARRPIPGATG